MDLNTDSLDFCRMCNWYELFNIVTGLFSMDWSLLGEMATNAAVYLGYEAIDIYTEIMNNTKEDCHDEALEAGLDV